VEVEIDRRSLLVGFGALAVSPFALALTSQEPLLARITDPEIRRGVEAAVLKNLIPAATQSAYPGYFNITADGSSYGGDATWPGLDSWQMAGAYLLLGRTQLVLDYFEFVRASQHSDGNVPFAIFREGTERNDNYLRGLDPATGTFSFTPKGKGATRKWVGLFHHWEIRSDPLSTLAPICYVLTAAEIFRHTRDVSWLRDRLASVASAGSFVAGRIGANGLVAGSGFYVELPPRWGFDGVTQCYAYEVFRNLAELSRTAGHREEARQWEARAKSLRDAFVRQFWRDDHFGEYVHIERGLVDSHGLSDTNWAAIAFGLVDGHRLSVLWPKLLEEKAFWWGDMPTQLVTKPFSYETWEEDPVPFDIPGPWNDVAAMGRVWYLEAMACRRMKAAKRLQDAARLISRAAYGDGFWRERYQPQADGTVKPYGAQKYCEYAAVLIRVVLGNPDVFMS